MPQLPPLKFVPHLVPKIWGGSRLPQLLRVPGCDGTLIGEAWTVSDLPAVQPRVCGGPMAGMTLRDLCRSHGRDLLGEQAGGPTGARYFPLLSKLLDAVANLSIQVHPLAPQPGSAVSCSSYKHECWYVIAAEHGARAYIGLKPGVTRKQLKDAAGSARVCELMIERPARPGDCFYLPPGIVHALGAGILVAEYQTPSQITYRLYDWERAGGGGERRVLHVEEALANVLFDFPESHIVQSPRPAGDDLVCRCACPCFEVYEQKVAAGASMAGSRWQGERRTAMLLTLAEGAARVQVEHDEIPLDPGETLVVPANGTDFVLVSDSDLKLLHVRPTAGN